MDKEKIIGCYNESIDALLNATRNKQFYLSIKEEIEVLSREDEKTLLTLMSGTQLNIQKYAIMIECSQTEDELDWAQNALERSFRNLAVIQFALSAVKTETPDHKKNTNHIFVLYDINLTPWAWHNTSPDPYSFIRSTVASHSFNQTPPKEVTMDNPWRNTPPDREGWWWLYHPTKNGWTIPTPYYFRKADPNTLERTVVCGFVSDGPSSPFSGWGRDWICAPMDSYPDGWNKQDSKA
jgi:hypothetical protein